MLPETKNIILASADQVAIDAVAAKMMGFDPLSLKYIRIAQERGLGSGDPRQIELVGDDVSGENWHFEVGHTFHSFLGYLSWYGPTRHLQKLIFHTPIAKLTYLVSEIYHDYYRWTFRDRQKFEHWRQTSPWGTLIDQYRQKSNLVTGRTPTPAGENPKH